MAQVRFAGDIISAQPIKQLDGGEWLMEARQHGVRFAYGTNIRVPQVDIFEMASAEMPATSEDEQTMSKLSELAAMAAEKHKEIETKADKSIDRLTKAHAKAHSGIDKLDELSAAVEKGVAEIEDFANQMSNNPPLGG